jgi:beta-alanine degradation protein BauB
MRLLRRTAMVALASNVLCWGASAADPLDTDGDKYKLRFENDRVRVLEYRDLPGEKTKQHYHRPFVLFAITPFKRTVTLPDGKVLRREFKAGEMLQSEAQTHIGENVGDTPTHVLIIEMK